MTLIHWNPSLSIDIEQIDQEHQKLIKLLNDLHEAMLQRRAKESLLTVIDGLIDYTKTHFATEENYFKKFNYSETTSHQKEHAYFVSRTLEFKKEFSEGKSLISVEILEFLRDWLIHHIQGTDKKYVSCFQKNGVK